MNDAVAETVALAIESHFGSDAPTVVGADQDLERDLGLDALDVILVGLRLEESLGLELSSDALRSARTVGDIVAIACAAVDAAKVSSQGALDGSPERWAAEVIMNTDVLASTLLVTLTGCMSTVQEPARAGDEPSLQTAGAEVGADAGGGGPEEGSMAPDFVALGHDGTHVALSELRSRTVILFFYTRDDAPLDTREITDFRAAAPALKERGILVIGVSRDSAETHRTFAERLKIPFPLLSDASGSLARAFGVPAPYGWSDRRTFVIGPDGAVQKVYRDVVVPTHVAELVTAIGTAAE